MKLLKGDNYDSLSINETTCILSYDGTKDLTKSGVKPIAVQVEDFDENGNVRSSVPVQFLAAVWTPERFKRRGKLGKPYSYGDFFPKVSIFPKMPRPRNQYQIYF